MQTIKMTGRGAVVITIDKHEFRPKNGVLEIPPHLEKHAIAQGFRRMTAAELDAAQRDGMELAASPATETLAPPAAHPEAERAAAADAKLDETIAAKAEAAKGTTKSAGAAA